MNDLPDQNRFKRCPACDKDHEIFTPLPNIAILICPLIKDLIYVNNLATKPVRLEIKNIIFGE